MADPDLEEVPAPTRRIVKQRLIHVQGVAGDVVKIVVNGEPVWRAKIKDGTAADLYLEISGSVRDA